MLICVGELASHALARLGPPRCRRLKVCQHTLSHNLPIPCVCARRSPRRSDVLAAGPRSARLTNHHPSLKKYRLLAPVAQSNIYARAKSADRALTNQETAAMLLRFCATMFPYVRTANGTAQHLGMEMFRSTAGIQRSQFSGTCRPNLYEDLTPCPIGTP